MTMGLADSGGYRIHYEDHGQGRPAVLVHGWSSSVSLGWSATGWIDSLRAIRRVVALDVRGHGESDKPRVQERYGYAAMADDVLAVMDHLDIERADLIGHSLGAFSGMHLLGHHAHRFAAMVLMGIGDEDADSLAALPSIVDGLRAEDPSALVDPISAIYRRVVDLDPRNDREALALAALQMWPEGYPIRLGGPALSAVSIPVLVLNGADDVPYVHTDEALVAAIAGAVLQRIPDADHLAPLFDERFKEAVHRFLSQQPAPSP